jgi:hypothetical protein
MLKFLTLTENEKKLLLNFIRFADENSLTRLDAANIHTNTSRFGVRPLILKATFEKLCDKSVLTRTSVPTRTWDNHDYTHSHAGDDDTYYYEIHPDFVDEIDDLPIDFSSTSDLDGEKIPASDRFVSIKDNQALLVEAKESLTALSELVRGSNDLFADADERIQVSAEINYIKELIDKPKIHVLAVWDNVKNNNTLKWLVEQSVSGVVRHAAVKAMENLDKLLHVLASIF